MAYELWSKGDIHINIVGRLRRCGCRLRMRLGEGAVITRV